MSTPHNAAESGDIAKTVLMPGDPLRAKFIAERYLDDARCFSDVRNMLGFTGTYHGVPISVMGSGMGIPSISIYAYELYNFYGVDTIMRIGTAGGIAPEVKLRDIVLGQAACTDSSIVQRYGIRGTFAPIADFGLLRHAARVADGMDVRYHVGNLLSTDAFYNGPGHNDSWAKMGVLAVEMEAAGLYLVAAQAHKRALGIMTVSDLVRTGEGISARERETSCMQMAEVALAVAVQEAMG